METLPPVTLGASLLGPFILVLVFHNRLERFYVISAPEIDQPKRQFYLELSLPLVMGIIGTVLNRLFHGFPFGSGLTLIFGFLVVGFFISLDMSLARERGVIHRAMDQEPRAKPPARLYSMTRKFTWVSFTATLFVSLVIGLVVTRDFVWLTTVEQSSSSVSTAWQTVIYEIAFIMAVLLAYVVNLVFSYSKNLKLLFNNETDVLEKVSGGDLSRFVPVVTADEFGVIAGHTNSMIRGLRHRIQLLTSLKLAEEVQQNLLPKDSPRLPGLDISGRSKYCDQTGGDYYDYFNLPNGRLGVMVADASDHGIGAALHMTTARAFLKYGARHAQGPTQLLKTVNQYLTRDSVETGRFMSVFFLEIDLSVKTFRWIRAGHDPALLYDPTTDHLEVLSGEGTALGVVEDVSFQESVREGWNPGSVLVIGTDGIREARNEGGEMFGMDRFREVIRKHAANGAADIRDAVIGAVEAFQGSAEQEDDITLVVVKLL